MPQQLPGPRHLFLCVPPCAKPGFPSAARGARWVTQLGAEGPCSCSDARVRRKAQKYACLQASLRRTKGT